MALNLKYSRLWHKILEENQKYFNFPFPSVILNFLFLQVIGLLLRTDKVYEKSKSRLRLTDCGYSGLVNLMEGCEVSMEMIKSFLEQVSLVGRCLEAVDVISL